MSVSERDPTPQVVGRAKMLRHPGDRTIRPRTGLCPINAPWGLRSRHAIRAQVESELFLVRPATGGHDCGDGDGDEQAEEAEQGPEHQQGKQHQEGMEPDLAADEVGGQHALVKQALASDGSGEEGGREEREDT